MILDKIIASVAFALLLLTLVLIASIPSHCTTTKARPNSLGLEQTYENSWAYMVGSPIRVNVFEEKGKYFTNVEFNAFGDSLLNSETMLFCGNQVESFNDGQLRAVIYRKRTTRMYQWVGCHELLRVLLIDTTEGQ